MRVALRTLAICGVAGLLGITVIAQDTSQSEQETAPAVIKQVKAEYTKEAMDARIEGTVRLEAAVLTDGSVGEV